MTIINKWSSLIIDVLYENGLRHVCISPGSRNTPLSLAFLNHNNIACYSQLDERSAGFLGLGIAMKTNSPTAILCTSGTAVANFLPAVIEADLNRIPILIISADRPQSLVGTGENQTINQNNIFNNFNRKYIDIGLPNQNYNDLINKLNIAYSICSGNNVETNFLTGPVHINCSFEEPLYNDNKSTKLNFDFKPIIDHPISNSFVFEPYNNPVIICGRLKTDSDIKPILDLSKILKIPILADPLSQIRYGHSNNNIISCYNHYIDRLEIEPDIVFYFGLKPVSKKLCEKMKSWNTILIDSANGYNNSSNFVLQSDVFNACQLISESIESTNGELLLKLQKLEEDINCTVKNNIDYSWSEINITSICYNFLNDNDNMFIGNSMPIRNMDNYIFKNDKKIFTYSNRGASGIDGVLSTSLGVALSSKSNYTLLLIGDLSFLHDINSLLINNKYAVNITIVVINNNGGGIFSLLPVSKKNNVHFSEYWTTPHNLDLRKIADSYEVNYYKSESVKELHSSLESSYSNTGISIIDCIIDINENIEIIKELNSSINKNLN